MRIVAELKYLSFSIKIQHLIAGGFNKLLSMVYDHMVKKP